MARIQRRILSTMLYLALVCLLIAPGFAPARLALAAGPACTVAASGASYITVQAAVNDANCASINIAAGTYSENVTINRSVSLQGAGAANTIIDGHTANSVFIIGIGAAVTIAGITATHGQALDGGGIANSGSLTLNDSSVSDNQGSGIRSTGDVTITNTTISGNQTLGASFIRTETTPATVALTNVTISGNGQRAIENTATLTITNSSIANNGASNGDILNNGSFTLKNTIIANSTLVPNCAISTTLISNGHNIDSGNTCGLSGPGDLINTDPKLGQLRDNGGPTRTQALRFGSPAINAGDNSGCPAIDQRGATRIATCDIGAYEYHVGPALSSISPASIEEGSPDMTLIVNGSGFTNGATVQLNGIDRPTTFVSASKLLAALSANDLRVGTIEVTVAYPGLAGISLPTMLTVTPYVTDRSGIAYVGSIGGGVPTVAISGTLAYIGEGSQLTIVDVTNPAAPARLGSFTTSANVQDIELVGTRAYLAADRAGLLILDVSDALHPTLLGSFDTPGRAYDLQVVGTRAYVADEEGGLRIIDVSNPTAPTELGSFHITPVYDLSIVGNTAYLATGNSIGLDIVDISDPAHPTELGKSYLPSSTLGVQVIGTTAYVAAGNDGLDVLNVANPQLFPMMIGSLGSLGKVKDLAVAGNRAYVVNYDGTLHILDISDPAHPSLLASYDTPGNSWDVRVVGTRAYIADGVGGLLILDVSDSLHPTKIGTFATWSAYKIKVAAQRAYIAGGSTGLQILDVTNPAQPSHLGSFTTIGAITNLALDGNRAVLVRQVTVNGSPAIGSGIEIVDVADPSHVTSLGDYLISLPNQVQVIGTRAYVAASDGLHILDISNPGAITQLGLAAGNYSSVQVIGNRAYLANGSSGGLTILDLSNPAAPTTIGSIDCQVSGTPITALQVIGNTAYIAGAEGLCPIDVSDPAHPLSASIYFPLGSGHLTDFKIVGSSAYLTESDTSDGHFDLVDAPEPIPPVLNQISEHDLSQALNGVDVVGNLAYTVSEQGGLHILRIHPEIYPATTTITPAGGSLTNRDGSVTLAFPPNAVTTPITITYSGLVSPTQSLGGAHSAGYSFLLEARDSADRPVTQFAQPYTLTISYTDEQLAALGINEADLNLGFWNGSTWVGVLPCAGCGVDTINNRLTAVLNHFTEFALVSGAAVDGTSRVYLPLVRR